jgi:hypothetical protein
MVMDRCSSKTPRYDYAASAKMRLHAATPQPNHVGTRLKSRRFHTPEREISQMKLFSCQGCGQLLYFENIRCESCGRPLGYLTDLTEISALEPKPEGGFEVLAAPGKPYKFCHNYDAGMCNWMLPAGSPEDFCAACRHNRTVPDLSVPGNDALWRKIETAKHRLFYSLLRLGLPLENRTDNPEHGLAFDFLADPPESHAAGVMTGHDKGLITLAIREADDAVREKVRGEMGEPYRTLLGHFRHEVGHYFWDVLVRDGSLIQPCRKIFGDETADYGAALQAYYANGAPANWQNNFISAYATSHPWEDFAETWAHYLHIVDTLEMARAFGMYVHPRLARPGELDAQVDFDPYAVRDPSPLIQTWIPLSNALNSLNRTMGQSDIYPFILSPPVVEKLSAIHNLVHGNALPVKEEQAA